MDDDQGEEDRTDVDVGVDADAVMSPADEEPPTLEPSTAVRRSPADEEPRTLEPPSAMSIRVPGLLSAASRSKSATPSPLGPIITPSDAFETGARIRIETVPDDPAPTRGAGAEEADAEIETSTSVMSDAKVRAAFISVLTNTPHVGESAREPLVSSSDAPTDPMKPRPPGLTGREEVVAPGDPVRAPHATLLMPDAPRNALETPRRDARRPSSDPERTPAPAVGSPASKRGSLSLVAALILVAGGVGLVAIVRPATFAFVLEPEAPPMASVAPFPTSAGALSVAAVSTEPVSTSADGGPVVGTSSARPRPVGPARKPRGRPAPPPKASPATEPSAI